MSRFTRTASSTAAFLLGVSPLAAEGVAPGRAIRMGQALMRDTAVPASTTAASVSQES